jgi:holo-[acyl-carrier protein] synthase
LTHRFVPQPYEEELYLICFSHYQISMTSLATGIDSIEIERVHRALERYRERLLHRIYTPAELAQVGENPASLAARFAAKEAVAKALGTGIGIVTWHEIEVLRNTARKPFLKLHGTAAQIAQEKNLTTWSISLSHSQSHAIAMVVAIGE